MSKRNPISNSFQTLTYLIRMLADNGIDAADRSIVFVCVHTSHFMPCAETYYSNTPRAAGAGGFVRLHASHACERREYHVCVLARMMKLRRLQLQTFMPGGHANEYSVCVLARINGVASHQVGLQKGWRRCSTANSCHRTVNLFYHSS